MAPMYYRGAKAAICVFDVTNEESFHRVASWLRDLKAHADQNVVICLAGNKCDKPETFDLVINYIYIKT
jgi:GTPase SAR1 family protein